MRTCGTCALVRICRPRPRARPPRGHARFGQGIPWDPQARERIHRIIDQHRQFLGRLDRLVQELERLRLERLDSFAGELESLFSNLRWHDAVETGLLKRLSLP